MVMGYTKQALFLHNNRGLPNPKLADLDNNKIMTNTVKKYRYVPKHQEMISNGMFHFISKLAKHTAQDSFVHVITNWIILGAYTGYCKSEWCNNHPEDFAKSTDPQWGTHCFPSSHCGGLQLCYCHRLLPL